MQRAEDQDSVSGVLYIVSTPIGNLGDITYRAVEVLREADVILAEDTRRTRILLDNYAIEGVGLQSLHKHNEAARAQQATGRLREGAKLALVSDSGTPLLSDPGLRLVRATLAVGARVVPVPGPSAALAALVASGLDPEPFSFYGFPPRSGRARKELWAALAGLRHTALLFESPQRLERTLKDLRDEMGGERRVAVARELTKLHEEVVHGTLDEALAYYGASPPRGEVVICLAGAADAGPPDLGAARGRAVEMAEEGATAKEIVEALRTRLGLERNRAYDLAIEALEGKGK